MTECEQICLTKEEPEVEAPSAISKAAICRLEFDTGLASCGDQLQRWYFNPQLGTCSAFIYSGCAGNQNRFKTFEVCMGFCEAAGGGGARAPPQPGRDLNIPPPEPGLSQGGEEKQQPLPGEELDQVDCSSSEERCSYALTSCEYGVLRYQDDRTRCEECYCNQPCHGFQCPLTTTCQVEPYTSRGETVFRAVCRDDTKPGICPKVNRNEYANCEEECTTDGDCSGQQKCCYNGCGKSCMQAAEDPYMVEYEDDSVAPVNPDAPIIEVVNTPVIVPEGDIATLGVRVRGNPQPDVYWRKGRTSINPLTGRFRILPSGALQIVGVRREDEGSYECFADNGLGPPVSQTVVVAVDQARDLPARILETEPDIVMSLNAPATLYCLAYGFPKPTVTWWKGTSMLPLTSDRVSQGDDFTLKLSSVRLSDLGPYTCQAYNGLGEAASFNVRLTVYGPVNPGPGEQQFTRYVVSPPSAPARAPQSTARPGVYRPSRPEGWDFNRRPQTTRRPRVREISARIALSTTRFPLNSYVRIPCDVNSGLRPSISWMKDGAPLDRNARVRVLFNNTLAIDRAQPEDGGNVLVMVVEGKSMNARGFEEAVLDTNWRVS